MNSNIRKRKKQKQKEKKIVYNISQEVAERINRNFIQHFNYKYWHHKLNALYGYISDPTKIETEIKYEYDNDLDETVIENFKLEIHMEVFHSAETLFLVIFGFLYEPKAIPLWISRCSSQQLRQLIKKLAEGGLESFITKPDEWLRAVLYPAIDESHQQFEDSKLSTKFTKNYLKRLAQEYIDHVEYNSFKHGLRCSPGQVRFQFVDDKSQTSMLDSTSDAILFLELDKVDKGKEILYKVKESSKTYDVKRDGDIIVITTHILSNIFDYRQLAIKKQLVGSDCKIKFLPYFFNTEEVGKLFEFDIKGAHGGFVTRFSFGTNN